MTVTEFARIIHILDKISKKNKAFRKFTNCKNPLTKEHLNEEYKSIKNELITLTQQSKKDYLNQYFTHNTKNLQKGIKEIVNIKTKMHTFPTCIIDNKKTITNPKDIADSFNKYYTSVAEDILCKRKYEGNTQHTTYLNNPIEGTYAIYDCTQSEIENIISSFNPRKATEPNSIPSDILQILKKRYKLPSICHI